MQRIDINNYTASFTMFINNIIFYHHGSPPAHSNSLFSAFTDTAQFFTFLGIPFLHSMGVMLL